MKINKPKIKINKPEFKREQITLLSKRLLSGFSLITILGLFFLLLNILSERYHVRMDLTENQIYSLSGSTKNLIRGLEGEVTIDVFFSDNLPPALQDTKQNALDIFNEYQKNSNGKINVIVHDPLGAGFEDDAISKGIQQIQFSEYSEDSFAVAQGFFGASISHDGLSESIAVISDSGNLEYETTSRIFKLTTEQSGKIGFLTGHGEKSIVTDISEANQFLQTQFSTEEVDLSKGQPLDPNELAVLVIPSPTESLSQRDLFEIEQYVLKGGSLLVLSDLYALEEGLPIQNKSESNINELFKIFGIEQESKLVLDQSYTPIISGLNRITYPYWVLFTPEGFEQNIPALSELSSATFLWSSPFKKVDGADLELTELLNTTENAWTESGESIDISVKEFAPTDQSKQVLGYLIEGPLTTTFEKVPALSDKKTEDLRTEDEEVIDSVENARIVMLGDIDFITDNYHNANEQNMVLFLNLVEWLANSEELTEIRAKTVAPRPLDVIEQSERNLTKILITASAPVVVGVVGFIYLKRRKKMPSQI